MHKDLSILWRIRIVHSLSYKIKVAERDIYDLHLPLRCTLHHLPRRRRLITLLGQHGV